jgi:sirohydrochlorin cobaltochelatase
MSTTAIILFAHGAREPEWARPFEHIRDRLRAAGIRTELAFLEVMSPSLEEAAGRMAADAIDAVTVVPLFLAQGRHLKRELPERVAAIQVRHREIRFRVAPPLGEAPELIDAITAWIQRSAAEPAAPIDRAARK